MHQHHILILVLFFSSLISCNTGIQHENQTKHSFQISNLSDADYPDNPDIGFRASDYQNFFFTKGEIEGHSNAFIRDFTFFSRNNDTISLKRIDISELIPTIPSNIKGQPYLSYISFVNQEWNRNQIQFKKGEFYSSLPQITRLDLARNCLNSYLWEVILYTNEEEGTRPYAHGWFDFPHDLYATLFEVKNEIPFSMYKESLENWVDPESKIVNLDLLRTLKTEVKIGFTDLSDNMYPLKGARKKKRKEIIYPAAFSSMRELQSDSTLFATFTPPGFYNKNDPRETELGRLRKLESIQLREISSDSSRSLHEIELTFRHKEEDRETRLIIGGLDLDHFPVLNEDEANLGWKNSMGIGNHTFYETYEEHLKSHTDSSPYYAMLLDEDGKWLDSHKIGIDGPVFHFSNAERTALHLWLLSFERHALVGHYRIDFL